MRMSVLGVVVSVLAWGGAARAATTRPVDLSEPGQTYRTLLRALVADDTEAVRACFAGAGPVAGEAIAHRADDLLLAPRLERAAVAKLGDAAHALGRPGPAAEDLEAIERKLAKATVQVTGETAVLSLPMSARVKRVRLDEFTMLFAPLPFVRQGGDWKIDLNKVYGTDDLAKFMKENEDVALGRERAAAYRDAIEAVRAGRFKTFEGFSKSWAERTHRASVLYEVWDEARKGRTKAVPASRPMGE